MFLCKISIFKLLIKCLIEWHIANQAFDKMSTINKTYVYIAYQAFDKTHVSLCKVDILKIDQDLKIERGLIVALRKEKEELEHDASRQKKHLHSMSEIANELESLSNQCRLGLLTVESVAKSFGDLQKVFHLSGHESSANW